MIELDNMSMNLKQETINLIKKYDIKPDLLREQHFIVNKKILEKIIKLADINPNEIVLEIGCGLGTLTKELAKKAKEIHGIEIDKQFSKLFAELESEYPNLSVTFGDAWKILRQEARPWPFNKVVSNLPYRLCEPLFHKFTGRKFKLMVFMVPEKFAWKALEHPIFTAFYNIKKEFEIPKKAFYPIPRANSIVLSLTYKPPPLSVRDAERFIRQYIYIHEDALLRNSLMGAILQVSKKLYKKKLTKNQAREMVQKAGVEKEELEKRGRYTLLETYFKAAKELERLLRK